MVVRGFDLVTYIGVIPSYGSKLLLKVVSKRIHVFGALEHMKRVQLKNKHRSGTLASGENQSTLESAFIGVGQICFDYEGVVD